MIPLADFHKVKKLSYRFIVIGGMHVYYCFRQNYALDNILYCLILDFMGEDNIFFAF